MDGQVGRNNCNWPVLIGPTARDREQVAAAMILTSRQPASGMRTHVTIDVHDTGDERSCWPCGREDVVGLSEQG